MAKGQRRSVAERLTEVQNKRGELVRRYEKQDAPLAKQERELQEKLVREQVLAEVNTDVEAKVAERLAELQNGDANEVASVPADSSDNPLGLYTNA